MIPLAHHSRRAFTLIEVLIAAAIFAVGLIAVAAIFPTAIQLQKQTFEQIRGEEFVQTTRQLVLSRGFDERIVAARAEGTSPDVTPRLSNVPPPPLLPQASEPSTVFSAAEVLQIDDEGWLLTDRSGGSLERGFYTNGAGTIVAPGTATHFEYAGRNLFWTPLFIDLDPRAADNNGEIVDVTGDAQFRSRQMREAGLPDPRDFRQWQAFIFVLRSEPGANYPRVSANDVLTYADRTSPTNGADLPQDGETPLRIPVPGVAEIRVANPFSQPNRFDFDNRVAGTDDPIVRIGDRVLAANGIVYQVTDIDPNGTWIEVPGTIVDRQPAAVQVTRIWAAHPGDSGDSSLIDIIAVNDNPDPDSQHFEGENNLIR